MGCAWAVHARAKSAALATPVVSVVRSVAATARCAVTNVDRLPEL